MFCLLLLTFNCEVAVAGYELYLIRPEQKALNAIVSGSRQALVRLPARLL